MGRRHPWLNRALGRLLASALVVPLGIVASISPAQADPPAYEAPLKQLIKQTSDWAEAGLSRIGALAQPLPLLGISPGSLVDADRLVKRVSDALAEHGLTNDNRDLGNGARLFSTVAPTPDGGTLLDLTLTTRHQVDEKDFGSAGITASKAVSITGWTTLRLKAQYLNGEVFLVRDNFAPRLDIDAAARFRADLAAAKASVGILEVALLAGSTLAATTHLLARVTDGNGDGKLAFGAGGELSAAGSLAGLLQVGLDTSGGGKISDTQEEPGPGSIDATMKLGAATQGAPVGLPVFDAAVIVKWPNVSTGTPSVETPGLDGTIAKFRNMGPQDLAAGIAQLVTLLSGVQQSGGAGNLDLPFLKGTFADAVRINEKLKDFLKKYVFPSPEDEEFVKGTDDPARAGQPRFTSVQEFLRNLQAEGLLANTPLTFADDKLAFAISLSRSPPAAEIPLDAGSAGVSGKGATFTPSGFSLPDNRFEPGALVGQRVVAGTSAGEVKSNTANAVELTREWIGGRPADDSSWVISSSDPHIGAVQLGGLFTALTDEDKPIGLKVGNAQQSLARVKPSYEAKLTLVLDLRDDLGSPEANADRVLLRTNPDTPLFTANFPISSQIDFYAKIGFFKVRVNGSLGAGPVTPGTDMLRVKFKTAQDISLGNLFKQLKDNPAGLFEVTHSVRTQGQARLSVPGDTGLLGQGVGAGFSWVAGAEPVVNTTNLDGLFSLDFNADDPNALFAIVVDALGGINKALASANGGSGLLDQEIPFVGKSGRELLGSDESGVGGEVTYAASGTDFTLKDASRDQGREFSAKLKDRTVVIGTKAYRILNRVDGQTLLIAGGGSPVPETGAAYAVRPELVEAVDRLLANPPENLQDALDVVNNAIGAGSALSFTLDQREGGPYLRLGLNWKRAYHTATPINFSWQGVGDLVTLDSAGALSLTVTGDAQLGLLLPLRLNDNAPLLDHISAASVKVSADASDVALAARAGPLALSIGKDGDFAQVRANLKFGLTAASDVDKPVLDGLLGLTPQLTTDGTDCTNGVGGAGVPLCARAPIFLNDCAPPAGTNVLAFQVDMNFTPSTPSLPDLGPCLQSLVLKFTDFNVGIDGYLAKLEEALRLASFDGKLPLVGDDLQQGERFIHQLREDIKAAIGPTLANAPATAQGLQSALDAALDQLGDSVEGLTVEVKCQDPTLTDCPIASVQKVRIALTKGEGSPSTTEGCAGDACKPLNVPLDLGIPGLSLKAKQGATDGVQVKFGWKLHLDMVLDRTEGFYIATHSGNDLSPELAIGASLDVDDLAAQLAFIQVTADKQNNVPAVRAYFGIDLRDSTDEESCFDPNAPCTADPNAKLTLAEFGDLPSLIKTRLNATVAIDWRLTATLSTGSDVGSALPGISVRFKLGWEISNHTGTLVPGNLNILFDEVRLEAGPFFQKILRPVLDKLKTVTGPLQPVIDTLYAPIPVLSDLSKAVGGDDITLISLARTFSTLADGPNLDFVDTIREVIRFVNNVPNCTDTANCYIPLGSFHIRPEKALDVPASPASAQSLIDPHDLSPESIKSRVDQTSNGAKLFTPDPQTGKTQAAKVGFQFPIFDKPASLFGLLLGQDVELISFDSGPLTLGFSWRQSFGPVYAPPPVMITLSGSASITARFIAGLDTKGIRHAIESATSGTDLDAVNLLDGLYFKTADSTGKAQPVVTLAGEIAAGAEVSVVVLKVGIEGGVRLTVGFSWNDPNNDGKFRISEFIQRLKVSPICLFTTSGQLSVFLRVYITIDLFLFSKTWSFTLVNAVLLDFRAQPDCEPPPPELGVKVDDTLVLYAGRFGTGAQRGDGVWDNNRAGYDGDVFKVYAIHWADGDPGFDGFVVEALGRKQEFLDPALTRVVVDGRGYRVPGDPGKTGMSLILLGDGHPDGDPKKATTFDRTAVIFGSDGPDNIRTGTGESYVDGGLGDDTIVTTNGIVGNTAVLAHVAGGLDHDSITTGAGTSTVSGDSTLFKREKDLPVAGGKTLEDIVDWTDLATPSAEPGQPDSGGNDSITVGHGANFLYGNAGNDTLAALVNATKPNGANVMVGGEGADTINGGNGNDKIYTYSENVSSDVDSDGLGDEALPQNGVNNVDTGQGVDEVWGSAGVDLVVSHSANGQTGKIYGYGGNDVLIGGYGTDQIFGGPGQDHVIAEPSNVGGEGVDDGYGPSRPVTHLPLPPGVQPQRKLLVGGLGSDHITGGDGGADIFGDKYLVAEACADNNSHVQPAPADQGDKDLILGGAGTDVVTAGSGDDRSDLANGNDRACGQLGNDTLSLGGDADKAWGGDGVDQIFGDSGADFGYGNEGDDGVYGGGDADVLEGNNGTDSVFGGEDGDTIYGGTRVAGLADAGDFLYGEEGADKMVGDNGSDAPYPFDLDGSVPTVGAGDVISGGSHNDVGYGGLGDDTMAGNADEDYLEGNNGTDTVNGNTGDDQIIGGSSQEASPGTGRAPTRATCSSATRTRIWSPGTTRASAPRR